MKERDRKIKEEREERREREREQREEKEIERESVKDGLQPPVRHLQAKIIFLFANKLHFFIKSLFGSLRHYHHYVIIISNIRTSKD